MNVSMTTRAFKALITVGAALTVVVSPASADTVGPVVTYFKAPLPIVGSSLADSSGSPSLQIKDGWSVTDGDGICYGNAHFFRDSVDEGQAWTAPMTGPLIASLVGNTYSWTAQVGRTDYLRTNSSDCLQNYAASAYDYVKPNLVDQNAASYGAGWTTSTASVWSGRSVMKSSTVGATATFSFSNTPLVSLISDKASNRGKVSLSVDGATPATVTLTSPTTVNRVIAWNSKFLSTTGTHRLTLKVVSGRVDIDAFLTQ